MNRNNGTTGKNLKPFKITNMKTLFILFASLSTFFAKAANTPALDPNPQVLESFQNTFNKAREVDWSAGTSFFKAQFTLDGQHLSAFYNVDGELIAITRNITTDALPVMLQSSLKKTMGNAWITNLFELSNEDGTTYYISIEDADTIVSLQSVNNKDWTVYKKSRKA
jgi:hypothetical protein